MGKLGPWDKIFIKNPRDKISLGIQGCIFMQNFGIFMQNYPLESGIKIPQRNNGPKI